MNEQEAVHRARAGDRDAFACLTERYTALLLSLSACYVGRADAADAAQEIWLAVWQKLWQLENGDAFLPWLRRVAYYHCLNYRKRRSRKAQRELMLGTESWLRLSEFVADSADLLEEALLRSDLRRHISAMLDKLPGDFGLLLRLRYMRELSLAEIVALTELPLPTVKWRLHEGRRILKGLIVSEMIGEGRRLR